MALKDWTRIGFTAWQKGSYLGDIIMIDETLHDRSMSYVVVKITNANNSNKQRKDISKQLMTRGTALKYAKAYMSSH